MEIKTHGYQSELGLMIILLLAAPTWLWGFCGRHNTHPANSVMDFISFFCRSDGSHVPVDTVHPSLLRSSLLYPRWYNLQRLTSDVVFVSPLTWQNHLNLAFLHFCVIFSTFSLSPMLSFLTLYLSVCPHAHLHIFISVISSVFTWELVTGTVSIPYSITG